MRPYIMMGHERAVKNVMYNRDGDLLFSSGDDNYVTGRHDIFSGAVHLHDHWTRDRSWYI